MGQGDSTEDSLNYIGRSQGLCVVFTILSCFILFSVSEIFYGSTNQYPGVRPGWWLYFLMLLVLTLALSGLYIAFEQFGRKNQFPINSVGSEWYIILFILMPLFGSMLVYFIDDTLVFLIIVPIEIILAILVLRGANRWYKKYI